VAVDECPFGAAPLGAVPFEVNCVAIAADASYIFEQNATAQRKANKVRQYEKAGKPDKVDNGDMVNK